jgi:ABC-2 type transport system ATP-binding protein
VIRAIGVRKVFRPRTGRLLWVRHGEPKVAVERLDLEVEPGRITGLLGLNGAGKTTTIKMLATLLHPDGGSISVDGLDVVRDAARVRPLVNVIAGGERSLYLRLTGRENLWYFGQLYGVTGARLKERIAELLALVELEGAADARVETYSKGMRQRLQIARGLVNRPRYLFLDEPTLGLDVPIARQLRRVTLQLAREQGCGIVLTSHYMSEVEELCDSITVIDHGRVVREGTASELKAGLVTEHVTRLIVSGEDAGGLAEAMREGLPAGCVVTSAPDARGTSLTVRSERELTGEAVARALQCGRHVLRAESVEPSLDDLMLQLGRAP